MTSKLGVQWSVMHRRPQDYAFFKQHQPAVFKIMDGGPPDYQFARDNLPNSLIVARDWALSEQKDDMARDPIGTGKRHAQEWNQHQQRLGFDKGKTLILGINEPSVWQSGVPEALRLYTIAMCEEATRLGLRVGAMQFSVGWPGNTGPDMPPNWAPWAGVEDAIKRNRGALVCHEYWANGGPFENWGWWAGRSLKCPWNVPIVIGEAGIDMYVKDGSVAHANRGWRGWVDANRYANELRYYTARMSADTRFVGCAVFAADFASGEWYSFDLEPAYQAILATPEPIPPEPPIDPDPPTPPSNTKLVHPLPSSIITQHMYQNPQSYARFSLPGHNGLDMAGKPEGTNIGAIADGTVAYVGIDEDYGNYVRIAHPQLGAYSFYAHAMRTLVQVGQTVKAGHTIALLGTTGNSTGVHLHLEIRLMNEDGSYKEGCPMPKGRVDPQTWAAMNGLKL